MMGERVDRANSFTRLISIGWRLLIICPSDRCGAGSELGAQGACPLLLAHRPALDLIWFMFVDPPFNVPIDGHVGGLGSIKHREFTMVPAK
jgi:hypothetical protein